MNTDQEPLECAADDCKVLHPNAVAWDASLAGWRCHGHRLDLRESAEVLKLERGGVYLMVIELGENVPWRHADRIGKTMGKWTTKMAEAAGCQIAPVVFERGTRARFVELGAFDRAMQLVMVMDFCKLLELALRRDHR